MKISAARSLYLFLAIVLALWTTPQCLTNITYKKNETLERPVGLQVYALSGGKFQINYYVQNSEDTFDGYNLYISRESTGDYDELEPYLLTGSTPTFLHDPGEVDLITPQTQQVTQFMDIYKDITNNVTISFVPFETGTRYYFKVRAHSRFNVVSLPSNEVSAVALP